MKAAIHLVLLPLVAAVAGGGAIAVSRMARSRLIVSAAGLPLVVGGVVLLVHMSGLPRPERPPFVLSGFGLAATGPILLPCAAARAGASRGARENPGPHVSR